MTIIFRRGADFEAEAVASDYFESGDLIRLAARALEHDGLLAPELDEHGRRCLRVVRDITADDLAFATAAHHKREVEGH